MDVWRSKLLRKVVSFSRKEKLCLDHQLSQRSSGIYVCVLSCWHVVCCLKTDGLWISLYGGDGTLDHQWVLNINIIEHYGRVLHSNMDTHRGSGANTALDLVLHWILLLTRQNLRIVCKNENKCCTQRCCARSSWLHVVPHQPKYKPGLPGTVENGSAQQLLPHPHQRWDSEHTQSLRGPLRQHERVRNLHSSALSHTRSPCKVTALYFTLNSRLNFSCCWLKEFPISL